MIDAASGGSWPDGQFAEREIRALRAQPAPLAGAAGGKNDAASGGSWPDGQFSEREREIRALRAQPAPLARAAGGKKGDTSGFTRSYFS